MIENDELPQTQSDGLNAKELVTLNDLVWVIFFTTI